MPWQLLDHLTASQGEIAILSSGCWFCKSCHMGGYDSFFRNKVSALRLNEDLIKCMAMQLIPGPLFFQEARGAGSEASRLLAQL